LQLFVDKRDELFLSLISLRWGAYGNKLGDPPRLKIVAGFLFVDFTASILRSSPAAHLSVTHA
jgi:hypothetical protein